MEASNETSSTPLTSEDIVGYQVCDATRLDVVNCVTEWLRANERNCHYFACLNPHAAEMASVDKIFHNSLTCADFLTADGIGVVYASRILGGNLKRRITGTDVFLDVTEAMNRESGRSCFFLGSSEETLDKIKKEMSIRFPRVEVAGTYSPPFKPDFSAEDNQAMIEAVNRCRPDVLWVGLTAPKQEKWIYEHQSELRVNFAGPIGAAFDFFVGNIDRAGPTLQNLGLEWLPRLLQEPRRLWRRTLVSAPKFLLRTIRYRGDRRRELE
jgi:N-acetylglucosaminyldiphosphoundecaprenol N-acetyl-beta-D-mannosaminyltransferase